MENLKEELERTLGKEVVEKNLSRADSGKSQLLHTDDSQLRQRRKENSNLARNLSSAGNSNAQTKGKGPVGPPGTKPGGRPQGGGPPRGAGRLMVDEKVETSAVKKDVYFYYARAVGISVAIGTLILQVVNQGFSLGTNFWLAKW